jgi:D-tagatose-1,6-bisphosphate aldolase subunit GatZ/KbaZ
VPVPGGEAGDMAGIQVTTAARLDETIATHRAAFVARGVPQGMERAIAVVVQPGVDFSHAAVFHYDRARAAGLTTAIGAHDGLGFEAHSTDYQSTEALAALVADRSVVLKVGPEITFRVREGIVALDRIEAVLNLPDAARTVDAVLAAMDREPADWDRYYQGPAEAVRMLQLYSYSDRIRYYWDRPAVAAALRKLIDNLAIAGLPAALATQYGIAFPLAADRVAPQEMIAQRVETTAERYYRACGWL